MFTVDVKQQCNNNNNNHAVGSAERRNYGLVSLLAVSGTKLLQLQFGVCACVVRPSVRPGHNFYIYARISK